MPLSALPVPAAHEEATQGCWPGVCVDNSSGQCSVDHAVAVEERRVGGRTGQLLPSRAALHIAQKGSAEGW